MLDKNIKIITATDDICLIVMICRNFRQAYLFKVGLMQILAKHKILFILCHVGLHIDFLSMKFDFNL